MNNLSFKTDVLPFIIATAGEFAALYFWLKFLDQDQFVLANVLLWAGFLVERVSVVLWIRYVYRVKEGELPRKSSLLQSVIGLLLITLSEVVIWIVWLELADGFSFWLAAVVLMILMLAEHSMEMAVLKKHRFMRYVTNGRTIFFTVMEVAGAVGWLYLVRHDEPLWGGVCLLTGLAIEHVLQGSQLKPDLDHNTSADARP